MTGERLGLELGARKLGDRSDILHFNRWLPGLDRFPGYWDTLSPTE